MSNRTAHETSKHRTDASTGLEGETPTGRNDNEYLPVPLFACQTLPVDKSKGLKERFSCMFRRFRGKRSTDS